MNWKVKSLVQNIISIFPYKLSYSLYYQLQRNFGSLKKGNYNPTSVFIGSIKLWKYIHKNNHSAKGKVFFEIGTGRVPVIPFSNFLMGAKGTTTVDLNPYIKEELCMEMLDYISKNESQVRELFGSLLLEDRFSTIMKYHSEEVFSLKGFLKICNITYLAPADAAHTALKEGSIDFCISYTVFEHIPKNILKKIMIESNRILKSSGIHVHRIDYSDHFSHSDNSISAINFLQYSDRMWKWYADNRYMYMNRLRHDDFVCLFVETGNTIKYQHQDQSAKVKAILEKKLLFLDDRFKYKNNDILSTTGAWFILERG